MPTPADHVVVCPVLVGRQSMLDALERAIAATVSGSGQVVAIAGEAGLGKSRLVGETQVRAAAAGLRVMRGHCFEPDASLPYAPIVDLLRSCIAGHETQEIVDCVGPDAPEIVKILPELGHLMPGLAPAGAVDPEQERRRILHALTQFFVRMAARGPVLIVLEDLHWSDDASLEFLAMLSRRIRNLTALVVLTYRSDEARMELSQFLAGIDRERLGTEWPLRRLSSGDVSEMISAIFDLKTPARPEFVDSMYSLTEGNPFFLEEVLKSLVASGDIFVTDGTWDRKPIDELRIPRSVHAAVASRTAKLSDDAGSVLKIAAIVGRRFDFALLLRMTSHDERTLLRLIKDLIAAQLVVEESADRFSFRHALTQQAISSDLLARERRSLHLAIAEAMRDLSGSDLESRLSELAYHFYAAEAWDEAYYYCSRVGESAQALNAAPSALLQFTRAIEAASHLGIRPPGSLLRGRGKASETLGDFDGALGDYERALEAAVSARDRRAQWQSLIDLGFLWSGRDYERAGDYFRRASELADAIADPRLRAWSMNRLGNWLVNVGRPKEGLEQHAGALAIFQAEGDDVGTAETQDLLGMANGMFGDLHASHAAHTRAIELLRPFGPSLALSSSLASRATYSSPSLFEPVFAGPGKREEAIQASDEAAQIAETLGSPAALAYAYWAGGATIAAFGDLGEGLRRTLEGLRIAMEITHDQWITGARHTLGQIYIYTLSPNEALEQLQSALVTARKVGSAWWVGNISACLGMVYLLLNDVERAQAAMAAFDDRAHEPQNLHERRVRWVWGLVSLARGDAGGALDIADDLVRTAVGGVPGQRIPSLLHLRGDALLALRRHDEATKALEEGRDAGTQLGAKPSAWQIHRSLGRAYQVQHRADDAAREFGAARAIIQAMAETIDSPALREHFEQAAAASLPALRPVTANRAAKEAFGGLTAREREVAALIARGLSNRDIAERLVLGERTIETHVGNVLSKLGFGSRAQIAAWAVQKGLTQDAAGH